MDAVVFSCVLRVLHVSVYAAVSAVGRGAEGLLGGLGYWRGRGWIGMGGKKGEERRGRRKVPDEDFIVFVEVANLFDDLFYPGFKAKIRDFGGFFVSNLR